MWKKFKANEAENGNKHSKPMGLHMENNFKAPRAAHGKPNWPSIIFHRTLEESSMAFCLGAYWRKCAPFLW